MHNRFTLSSLRVLHLPVALLVVLSPLGAQTTSAPKTTKGTAKAPAPVSSTAPASEAIIKAFVAAFHAKDYSLLLSMDYDYRRGAASIMEKNPQILWDKLIEQKFKDTVAGIEENVAARYWQERGRGIPPGRIAPLEIRVVDNYLRPSSEWQVVETRVKQEPDNSYNGRGTYIGTHVYVKVRYPNPADAPLDHAVYDDPPRRRETAVEFLLRDGLVYWAGELSDAGVNYPRQKK